MRRVMPSAAVALAALACAGLGAPADAAAQDQRWVAAWTAAPVATFPAGYTLGQPGPLVEEPPGNRQPHPLAFADNQVRDQSLRMIVRPGIGGRTWRVRLTNVFGTRPVTFAHATVAVRQAGATIERGTLRRLTFAGRRSVTVAAGRTVRSDAVRLRLADRGPRELAISLHVRGASGPMTWHGAAVSTNYVSSRGAGDRTSDVGEEGFPHATTSWFFLAGVDVRRNDAAAVVALGDSITDGYFASLNGYDRWPDLLQRRLLRRAVRRGDGPRLISVVNAGITGNMITGVGRLPGGCTPCDGPPALERLDRDVLGQPGVRAVILLEGINDLGGGGATAEQVTAGMRELVRRVQARGLEIIGATLTPSAGTVFDRYGSAETDVRRRAVNQFIRTAGIFDGVADFAAVTEDPADRSRLRAVYDTNTSVGGPGDHLHPNRAGFVAMSRAIAVGRLERFVRSPGRAGG